MARPCEHPNLKIMYVQFYFKIIRVFTWPTLPNLHRRETLAFAQFCGARNFSPKGLHYATKLSERQRFSTWEIRQGRPCEHANYFKINLDVHYFLKKYCTARSGIEF